MKLSDKLRYLREVEGSLRGLHRAMTQQELVRAIAAEMDSSLSQSYLSQIESGARPHLTNTSRLLLAKFFQVHPGYLVEDPEGYHAELLSELRTHEDKLDLWLVAGAERFRKDPDLFRALCALARHESSRECLLLLGSILETPTLLERLLELYRPVEKAALTSARESPCELTSSRAKVSHRQPQQRSQPSPRASAAKGKAIRNALSISPKSNRRTASKKAVHHPEKTQ